MKIRIIISAVLILFSSFSIAQKLTTSSRKAKKYYEEASSHLVYGHHHEANELLQKAIKADPQFAEAYLLLGDLNTDMQRKEAAIRYYVKSIEIKNDLYPQVHYYVAKLYMGLGNYADADKYFHSYIAFPDIDDYTKKDSERNILNCQFALVALQNPVDFEPINLGKNINSMYSEYFPTMTVDGKFILYTRRLGEEGKHQQEDFYVSIKGKNNKWVAAQNMGPSINTPLNEGAATISADGKTIIFTACEQNGFYGNNRDGYGSCDLFFTRRRGKHWSKPINLGPPINTGNWETQPSLSSDGQTLYFVRGVVRDHRRESDIYVTSLDKDGYWNTPVKLPPTINTEEAEESVLIHPNNRTLYFSSKGKIGMGGSDIYISRKDENGEWGEAVNLGYPINTFKDENSILVNPNGEIGYFASDREGGFGGLDIYGFEMPEEIKADPVTYFKGIVYDSLTHERLSSEIELIDLELDTTVYSSYSDKSNGQFFLTLTPDHNYMINVSKDGYLFYSDAFLIKDNFDQLKPFIKNIPLLPIEVGSSIVLKNIFFELDKSILKSESQSELAKLLGFLEQNTSISIEIAGHTDNQGSHEYNLKLSNDRANAVYDYLIEKGIDASRLQYKGYSFDKPIATNDSEKGRALNRRTEFIIIKK
jgi:outer membrane protein OmpA-like peptidoglycan-associated protein